MTNAHLVETRWLKSEDIPQLLTFAEPPIGKEELEGVLTANAGSVLCRVSNALSGYAVWEHNPVDLHLLSLTVTPERRRRGIATSLLRFIIFSAQGRNVVLEVSVENTGALKLYEAHGFLTIGRHLKYYNGIDAHVMALITQKD